MNGEIDVYGLYVPTLLLLALAALGVTRLAARLLAWCGAYRLVWHPALFDVALYVLVLGALVGIAWRWLAWL